VPVGLFNPKTADLGICPFMTRRDVGSAHREC